MTRRVIKAHAYGNDFLFVPAEASIDDTAAAELTRTLCNRHRGIGADGMILYAVRDRGATMKLWNADGSRSELSGNGLRCLAAIVARGQDLTRGAAIEIETTAGLKALELLAREGERYTFRAAMGQPTDVRQLKLQVLGEMLTFSELGMGNPQCVILGPLPDADKFNRLGPVLSSHALFPAGTNVEFAHVETPGRISILIWERGVGPTSSSGTGASAAAVAAAAHGGASRSVDVVAPGGTQHVDWRDDGVYLTGWAEIILDGEWIS